MENYTEERPWGTFENLLDSNYCKVKRNYNQTRTST